MTPRNLSKAKVAPSLTSVKRQAKKTIRKASSYRRAITRSGTEVDGQVCQGNRATRSQNVTYAKGSTRITAVLPKWSVTRKTQKMIA